MEGDSYRLYISGVWKKFQPTPSVGRATCASSHGTNLNLHFNPLPPWGGRPAAVAAIQKVVSISIHALRGEGDVVCVVRCRGKTADFNPRPPWGGRRQKSGRRSREKEFQSTPSVGRATRMKLLSPALSSHFNPRPPWGGRLARGQGRAVPERISIHALRGEGDRGRRSTYP